MHVHLHYHELYDQLVVYCDVRLWVYIVVIIRCRLCQLHRPVLNTVSIVELWTDYSPAVHVSTQSRRSQSVHPVTS